MNEEIKIKAHNSDILEQEGIEKIGNASRGSLETGQIQRIRERMGSNSVTRTVDLLERKLFPA